MRNRVAGSEVSSHQSPVTVGSLSEGDLIARIQEQLPPAPDWLLVGIGDDAAVVEPERNRVEVLSVDALVEGVHFDRAFVPPEAIGHRALAVNLSDLAAMGAAPRLALLSFALQAGREIRIMVESEKISDEEAVWLSKDIARRIENELEYPGQIKVTVIRETRAVDYAK